MKSHVEFKMRRQAVYAGSGLVLDVGCSANPNPFLREAHGLDIVVPQHTPVGYTEVVACDLNTQHIPYKNETFDAVIAGDVIEHLENPSHFLREVNRVLKSSGKLVLSTPQANDWWTTLHNWFFRIWIRDPDIGEHLQNWTMLDMVRLLKKNGFGIDAIEGLYIRFPYVPLLIPCRRCPILCWQVYYLAHKLHAPDRTTLTRVDGKWLKTEGASASIS